MWCGFWVGLACHLLGVCVVVLDCVRLVALYIPTVFGGFGCWRFGCWLLLVVALGCWVCRCVLGGPDGCSV